MTLLEDHAALCAAPPDPPPRARHDDAAVMVRSLGDPQVFATVFDRHWPAIHAFCTARAGAAGEDLAAEVFSVAFARRRHYDPAFADARPWLFGIATHLLSEYFRGAARGSRALKRALALGAGGRNAGVDEALPRFEAHMLGPELAAALASLPAIDRDALLLRAWAELDYGEIARALDIPIGTVRSRIHRARGRVRDYLSAKDLTR